MTDSGIKQDEAITIATSFANELDLPIGQVAKARHVSAEENARRGDPRTYGEWLIMFHYVGSLTPPHPKVTLRMDVGWLLCVLVNAVTGEAEMWED